MYRANLLKEKQQIIKAISNKKYNDIYKVLDACESYHRVYLVKYASLKLFEVEDFESYEAYLDRAELTRVFIESVGDLEGYFSSDTDNSIVIKGKMYGEDISVTVKNYHQAFAFFENLKDVFTPEEGLSSDLHYKLLGVKSVE